MPALTACPQCGYCLEHLPPEHVCPECGMDYDPDARLIRLRIHRWHVMQLVLAVLLVASMAVSKHPHGGLPKDAWFYGVFGGLLFVSWFKAVWSIGGDGTLLLNRNGVMLTHPRLGTRRMPWPMVRRAKYRRLTGSFVLLLAGKPRKLVLRRQDVGGREIARLCAMEENRLGTVYRKLQ